MKQVLVTGGTSGIGLAIARGFAEAGWKVTAAGLASEVASEASSKDLAFAALDVTRNEEVQACVAGHDSMDLLINAAGVIRRREEL